MIIFMKLTPNRDSNEEIYFFIKQFVSSCIVDSTFFRNLSCHMCNGKLSHNDCLTQYCKSTEVESFQDFFLTK